MRSSKIEKLIQLLRDSLKSLDAKFTESSIEEIAITINDSMSHPGRSFHNINHVFDVAINLDEVSVLAALFHDLIYYQVDQGFRKNIEPIVNQIIENKNGQFFLKNNRDDLYQKLLSIFGRKVGDELTIINGLNEFLSAYICIYLLGGMVTEYDLIRIAGLIEITIPFRNNALAELEKRLRGLAFSDDQVSDFCKRTVDFSNNDVANFSDPDPKKFLGNTWSLMSETNYSLRRGLDNFTILEYREAIYKSHRFFNFLNPDFIFNRYRNYPDNEKWNKQTKQTQSNVELGRQYLRILLVSTAIIESIALLTGGNAPMCLFMGDVRRRQEATARLEDYLGDTNRVKAGLNSALILLLDEGRAQESSFDMKSSPFASYIYKNLGEEEVARIFEKAKNFFDQKLSSKELLNEYPKEIISKVILACAKVNSTRKTQYESLLKSFMP